MYFKCGVFHRSEKVGNTNRTGDERGDEQEKEKKKQRRNRIKEVFFSHHDTCFRTKKSEEFKGVMNLRY